jgi:heme/copper-type cytochrome/quinol oxidase subunit 2
MCKFFLNLHLYQTKAGKWYVSDEIYCGIYHSKNVRVLGGNPAF